MKKYFIITVLLIVGYYAVTSEKGSNDNHMPVDKRYEASWRPCSDFKIAKALIRNEIKGCGQMYSRRSNYEKSEYLIACTRDGDTWVYYLVWPETEKVLGPLSEEFTPPEWR